MGKYFGGVAIWLTGLILQVSAVEVVTGPIVEASDVTARITWRTDTECGTRARYGLAPDKLDQKAEGGVAIDHEVLLTALTPGTEYHFNVGTARYVLKTGTFKTSGSGGGQASTRAPPVTPASPVAKPKPTPPLAPTVQRTPPPTRQTWANPYSLEDHFDRHGADFRATNADDYAAQAWLFFQRAMDEGLPAKFDEDDGTFRVYDPKTGAFAAYNKWGKTKTYFKPGSSGYFQRQPGKLVRINR